jgi:two-component system, NtrC family, sensor kinase
MSSAPPNKRILVVDDNPAIHADFAKILSTEKRSADALDALESALFGGPDEQLAEFALDFALQGEQALERVIAARAAGAPYAVAFIDMRMPPGWDGLETIERLWSVDRDLQVVICSAYSDHSWTDVNRRLGERDALLIIKKPFEIIEIVQCAHALTAKWNLARQAQQHVDGLEAAVRARTAELEATSHRLAEEIRHRDRVEAELRLSQKLESVGQLAAGIAHEINTPLQYVDDNLQFIRVGVASLVEAIETRSEMPDIAASLPESMDAIAQGVERMATIVGAMKELAHPGRRDQRLANLNESLKNALVVAASSYRYVATLELDLAELPLVSCFVGDLNQVFLNVILNAAHAMEDRSGPGRLGRLTARTRVDGGDVVVSISDTGCGIPEPLHSRIFDAFFTTKEVGRGSGQGLAISRSIVVDRHGGSLTFESTVGEGTTFHIRVPIAGPNAQRLAS